MAREWPLVAVAGKFQPFHNEHLDYVMAAFGHAEHVLIGITNPDPMYVRDEPTDPKRSLVSSNPFTYYERMQMVAESLAERGVESSRYSIVPFPINVPSSWFQYVPCSAVFLLTMYDDDEWLQVRKSKLECGGYQTHVLWRRATKGMTATQIRGAIRAGSDWRPYVPSGTAAVIERMGLTSRLGESPEETAVQS